MIKSGQSVLVDGIAGTITGVYPEGKGQYRGKLHAYIWVSTPSLNYTEHIIDSRTKRLKIQTTQNGRAVPFNEIEKRIEIIQNKC